MELSYHSTHHHILRKFSCPYRIWLDNSILIIQMTKRFGQLLQIRKDIYFVLHESAELKMSPEPGQRWVKLCYYYTRQRWVKLCYYCTGQRWVKLCYYYTGQRWVKLCYYYTGQRWIKLCYYYTGQRWVKLCYYYTGQRWVKLCYYYTGQRYIETIKSIVKSKRFSLK